ncbi:hypothetical protein [Thermosulfidibacter takaii]|nr:hypothetical protein [Thermosulfidibacter takaii]
MAQWLEFKGNWFIDLGILGFVNLMEEVYGWDLEKLKEKLSEEEKLIYYGFFPLAYMYKWLKDRSYPVSIEIPEEAHLEKLQEKEAPEIFEEVWWRWIVPMFEDRWVSKKLHDIIDKGKIPPPETGISSQAEEVVSKAKEILRLHEDEIKKILRLRNPLKRLNLIQIEKLKTDPNKSFELKLKIDQLNNLIEHLEKALKYCFDQVIRARKVRGENSDVFYRLPIYSNFFGNFLFFNPSDKNKLMKQKEDFYRVISWDPQKNELTSIAKELNKLFPSFDEFSNEFYTNFSSKNINIERLFIFLINFPYAFNRISGMNITFYSNSLKFSYLVNKKIKLLTQKERSSDSIFSLAWKGIIDVLYEHKASWALENMYLIQYRRLDNKVQEDVEYIGISKLQAEILADEDFRKRLNISIRIAEKGSKSYIWLLEEFLKNKPLLPVFYKNLKLYFAGKLNSILYPHYSSLIYSIAIDKVLKDLSNEKGFTFSDKFFNRNKSTISSIKTTANIYFSIAKLIQENFTEFSLKEKESLAFRLFSLLRKGQKYGFVNELLRSLHQLNGDVERFIRYLFAQILQNDYTWQENSIPIIAGFIEGGDKNE